jgi:hypothetical protein
MRTVITRGKDAPRPRLSGLGTDCAGILVMIGGSNWPFEPTQHRSPGNRRRFFAPAYAHHAELLVDESKYLGLGEEPSVAMMERTS